MMSIKTLTPILSFAAALALSSTAHCQTDENALLTGSEQTAAVNSDQGRQGALTSETDTPIRGILHLAGNALFVTVAEDPILKSASPPGDRSPSALQPAMATSPVRASMGDAPLIGRAAATLAAVNSVIAASGIVPTAGGQISSIPVGQISAVSLRTAASQGWLGASASLSSLGPRPLGAGGELADKSSILYAPKSLGSGGEVFNKQTLLKGLGG